LAPGKALSNRDRKQFQEFWILANVLDRVSYQASLEFEVKPCDLVIVDEADFFLLQNPALFKSKFKDTPVISFTSTFAGKNRNSIEIEILESLNY